MKNQIYYIDRSTGELKEEKIYGKAALHFFYLSRFGFIFAKIFASCSCLSKLYGWWQSLPITKGKIERFVKSFNINREEIEKPLEQYNSFNAFFTRRLKKSARPIAQGAILPADGRYLFYQNIKQSDGFTIKGKKFSLSTLLKDQTLANSYEEGSMIIARLSPVDYHHFHFPCDCVPGQYKLINGPLYSVNPLALIRRIEILSENKRMITELQTEQYGKIIFIEIGATNVGSIHQIYLPNRPYKKGDEKGFFSFGGSSIIMLFPHKSIQIQNNLLNNTAQNLETLCLFGQSLESKF